MRSRRGCNWQGFRCESIGIVRNGLKADNCHQPELTAAKTNATTVMTFRLVLRSFIGFFPTGDAAEHAISSTPPRCLVSLDPGFQPARTRGSSTPANEHSVCPGAERSLSLRSSQRNMEPWSETFGA